MTNVPVIYLPEQQLNTIILSSQSQPTKGVAFEWKDENVFHAFIEYPKVAPAGIPTKVYFKVFNTLDEFKGAKEYFTSIISEQQLAEKNQTSIGLFFFIDNEKLNHVAFLSKDSQIVDGMLKYIPGKSELYSRSKGLLETGVLEKKHVLIIGLGSFGSHIAIELAKAGVGNFTLVDFDRLELSNVARHICGINELGRYKTLAVRDAILVKNPFAKIITHEVDVSEAPAFLKEKCASVDLIICVTDNNQSRFHVNDIAIELKKVALFGRAITRAEGGDVFRLRPDGPCYNCLIGGSVPIAEEEISNAKQAERNLPAYMRATEADMASNIQVGLSSDILPMCNMMTKLALLELSKGVSSGLASLESELTYDYYIWSNRRDKEYKGWAPFNRSEGKPTILKWYGVKLQKDNDCLVCSLMESYE